MSDRALHFSRLKLMSRSAAHYALGYSGDSKGKTLGRAVHSYLLGDASKVVVYPGAVRRGKEFDAFAAEQDPDATILIASEMKDAIGMRTSIERHPRALELLEGEREQYIEWDWLGRACAGTPDVVSTRYLVELKTTRSSDPRRFPFDARRLHYNAQLAWYLNGLSLARGAARIPSDVYIVAVESSPPYPVTCFALSDELLEQGERLCRLWVERLRVCEEAGVFPAYAESDVPLDVPDNDVELDLTGVEEEVA